jgi:hypothetical protein
MYRLSFRSELDRLIRLLVRTEQVGRRVSADAHFASDAHFAPANTRLRARAHRRVVARERAPFHHRAHARNTCESNHMQW